MQGKRTCVIQTPDGSGKPTISHTCPVVNITEPHHVLIQVRAVALNPTDYKTPAYHPTPGAVMGCDFMGIVMDVGEAASRLSPGDRVCGVVTGSNPLHPTRGAFTEYLVADSRHLLILPDHWSDAEGAALGGVGWQTIALAMESNLGLTGTPSAPAGLKKDGSRVPVLVYGGATATGTMACQILSICGYDPIVTVSETSASLAKAFGAVATVPYLNANCAEEIRALTKGALRYSLDCITTPESVDCCLKATGRLGGRCVTLNYAEPDWITRKAVKFDMLLTYTATGEEVKLGGVFYRKADINKLYIVERWCHEVQQLLDGGMLKCHPVREVPGNWDGILRGLELLQSGAVRGQKLVVRLRET